MIEYHVVENASTGEDICGKVVGIVGRVGGARGPGGESGDDSSDREEAIKPKKQDIIAIALKRVTIMVQGAPKANSSVPREAAATAAAAQLGRQQWPN